MGHNTLKATICCAKGEGAVDHSAKTRLFKKFQVSWVNFDFLDSNKTAGEEARRQLHKNAASNIEQVLAATPNKAPTTRPPTSHHENYPN